jgi:hypothetical protein
MPHDADTQELWQLPRDINALTTEDLRGLEHSRAVHVTIEQLRAHCRRDKSLPLPSYHGVLVTFVRLAGTLGHSCLSESAHSVLYPVLRDDTAGPVALDVAKGVVWPTDGTTAIVTGRVCFEPFLHLACLAIEPIEAHERAAALAYFRAQCAADERECASVRCPTRVQLKKPPAPASAVSAGRKRKRPGEDDEDDSEELARQYKQERVSARDAGQKMGGLGFGYTRRT